MASLLLGLTGGALMGARPRRRVASAMAAVAGLAMVGMAARRPVIDALRRAEGKRRKASICFSFTVPHPVGMVFRFCSDFENFPRFIGALQKVHDYGDGRSRWVAFSPGGTRVEWNTVTTKYVPNRVIAWESIAQSSIRCVCSLRFVSVRPGGTCVHVAVSYESLEHDLGDALAALTLPPRAEEIESDIRRLTQHLDLLTARGVDGSDQA